MGGIQSRKGDIMKLFEAVFVDIDGDDEDIDWVF
jgi:hypothetical protein